MERNFALNTGNQLVRDIETEQVKLKASVNSEISVVIKMAKSPLVKRYFTNPEDADLEQMAFEEFAAFEDSIASNVVFWINDKDMIFHFSGGEPYEIDPHDPINYWYHLTIHDTEIYNFNINYNPEMDMMMLWINAPVFGEGNKPIGMLGCGINLSVFIDALYGSVPSDAEVFLFNSLGEITGAKDRTYIENKTSINEKLGKTGVEILERAKYLEDEDTIFFELEHAGGVAVVGSIPNLDWYITAIHQFTIGDSLKGGTTVLFVIMTLVMLAILIIFNVFASKLLYEAESAKSRAEGIAKKLTENIRYASKIQKNLLPGKGEFEKAFTDYSIIWEPRDVVGGDIYWAKSFDNGTVLCVCDCTGHGTSGALLTMLTGSAFESIITEEDHTDTALILYMLDKRLASVLHVDYSDRTKRGIMDINDGCDIAVLFISNDGSVTISAGNICVYVCDGKEVTRYKGQSIFIGEGALNSKDDVETVVVPANPDNKFYISSDGLYDQIGGDNGKRLGTKKFKQIILENHNEKQSVISEKIWEVFEEYRGHEPRRDDFEMITFKP